MLHDPPHFEPLTVVDSWDETHHLRGVRFHLAHLRPHHTRPGQVVKVRAPGVGEGYFALSTKPGEGPAEILLKRGHHVADKIATDAIEGAPIEVTPPMGKGFPVDEMKGRDVLLFAAGSGISPVRALLHHLLAARDEVGRVSLFYGQRFAPEFAYATEVSEWRRQRVNVTLCCSQPEGPWEGARGRVQAVSREQGFDGIALGNAVAYLCGMKGMVEGVRAELAEAGLPPERTFLNY